MKSDMWDNKDSASTDARVKAQAYWAGKLQQCPTQQNGNGGSNVPVSVSHEGAANKEASHPAYWTQDCGSNNGVFNGVSYTVC